jgi:spore coat protein U-like protein
VDQSQYSYNIGLALIPATTPLGQSFTAGLSGLLTDIKFASNGAINANFDNPCCNTLSVGVFDGDGFGGALLGTVTQSVSSPYDFGLGLYFMDIDVSSLNINVMAGSQYSFAIDKVTGSGDLADRGILGVWNTDSAYLGGQLYVGPGYAGIFGDLAFETRVDTGVSAIPEPETYAMLLAGLGLLGFAARRRAGFQHAT